MSRQWNTHLHLFLPRVSVTVFTADPIPDKKPLNGGRVCFGYSLKGYSSWWWGGQGIRSVKWLVTLYLHQEVESRQEESSSHTANNSLPPIRSYFEAWLLAGDPVFSHMNLWGHFTLKPQHHVCVPVCLFLTWSFLSPLHLLLCGGQVILCCVNPLVSRSVCF